MDGEERLHSTHTASGAVPVDRFVCRGVRQGEGFYSLRCSPVWYGRGGLVWCGMFWRNDDGSRQKWCFDQWQLSNGAFVFPWVHCLGLALVSLGMSPTAMIRGTQIQKVDGLSMSRVLEAMFVVQFLQTTAETTESNYLRQDNKREREREREMCVMPALGSESAATVGLDGGAAQPMRCRIPPDGSQLPLSPKRAVRCLGLSSIHLRPSGCMGIMEGGESEWLGGGACCSSGPLLAPL
jgi:hypothetical protein